MADEGEGMPQALQTDQKDVVDRSRIGRRSRRKGKTGELEVCRLFQMHGFTAARSFGQSRKKGEVPDVQTDLPLWTEVKRKASPNIPQAVEQAIEECGERPLWVVAFTKKNRGRWLVTMPAEDFLDLLKEWSAGR